MALNARFRDDAVVDALGVMPYMVGMLLSTRYTYFKGRSPAAQAVFMVGGTLQFTAFFIVLGLIAGRL